jgi:MYXO-CTERM domain-containing protein
VSQGATDDCACQVRASQPTSGAGGRALPWLVGLVGALALRRRRGTRQAARRLSAKFLA